MLFGVHPRVDDRDAEQATGDQQYSDRFGASAALKFATAVTRVCLILRFFNNNTYLLGSQFGGARSVSFLAKSYLMYTTI